MKLQYLGTAAAEAFPALFCECEACKKARQLGGKNIRGRSGAVINDKILIDFPPDIYMTSLNHNIKLSEITDIFFTHSHSDHCALSELIWRCAGNYCHLPDNSNRINLYGNEAVEKLFNDPKNYLLKNFADFHLISHGESVKINDTVFTFLPANHADGENSGIYLVEDSKSSFLYAHDTGIFPESTFTMLEDKKLDAISIDCCSGIKENDYPYHMNMEQNQQVISRLSKLGCIDDSTKIIVNHFSHNCGQVHEELVAEAAKYSFEVSFDGMILEL